MGEARVHEIGGAGRRCRHDLLPLVWLALAFVLTPIELVAIGAFPPEPGEEYRAVSLLLGNGVLAVTILLGTLLAITLPHDRHPRLRHLVDEIGMFGLGAATLTSHAVAFRVIFGHIHAPPNALLKSDPIFDAVLGLWIACGWVTLLALLVAAAHLRLLLAEPGQAGGDIGTADPHDRQHRH